MKDLLMMAIECTTVDQRTNTVLDSLSTAQLPTWDAKQFSGRMITIRLKSTPFNVTIIQLYEHTLDYSDEETDEFYEQLQYFIEQVAKKDILIVQSNWNAKVGEDGTTIWNIIWSIQAVTNVDTAQSKQ